MQTKPIDGKGALYFVRPQAKKLTRQEMRECSPSGVVQMDSMMGRSFTFMFLIKCGLVGIAAAYVFDWVIVSVLS